MPRSNWKGSISFGLVNIPVTLFNSEDTADQVVFHQIDIRNNQRIKYERVNVKTGKEVPWEKIGKAYQYDKEISIPVEDNELDKMAGENARTIAIESFVNQSDIHFVDIQKTYYLLPHKKADKGYVILRESLKKTKKFGIAKVIISTKEYLAAVGFIDEALVLYLLRYNEQIKPLSDFKFPEDNLKKYKVTTKEVDIGCQLIKSMSSKWKPEKYKDEYKKEIHKWAENKMKHKSYIMSPRSKSSENTDKKVDFVDLLRKSLGTTKKSKPSRAATHVLSGARKKPQNGKRLAH